MSVRSVPVLEVVVDLPDVQTEVATWEGASRLRLPYRQMFCHFLTEDDFIAVRDPRTY